MPDLAPSDLTQPLTAAEEFADVLDDLRQLSTGMLATQLHKASEGLGEWQAAWRAGAAPSLTTCAAMPSQRFLTWGWISFGTLDGSVFDRC